jgi:hypothetical protein
MVLKRCSRAEVGKVVVPGEEVEQCGSVSETTTDRGDDRNARVETSPCTGENLELVLGSVDPHEPDVVRVDRALVTSSSSCDRGDGDPAGHDRGRSGVRGRRLERAIARAKPCRVTAATVVVRCSVLLRK